MFIKQLYRLSDAPNVKKKSATRVDSLFEASRWNQKGYGIFWTPNSFKTNRRLVELTKINYWYIEMDEETKAAQRARILKSPIHPTCIVETKRGYHCYWKARDATTKKWREILTDRLVPFFDGDKRAKDLCRLLRVPGFFHLKNPSDPFVIVQKYYDRRVITQEEMLWKFKLTIAEEKQRVAEPVTPLIHKHPQSDDLWSHIEAIDCKQALLKLSGTNCVHGETYSFAVLANGKQNIYVNGKSTSCWIDRNKRIGSTDGGGPTIAQWLRWFGHSWSDTVKIIRRELLDGTP